MPDTPEDDRSEVLGAVRIVPHTCTDMGFMCLPQGALEWFKSELYLIYPYIQVLVMHLGSYLALRYGCHLQTANLFVTALREKMSADHPIRRFLTPFTYQTIAINDNAKYNLCAPRSMGPR